MVNVKEILNISRKCHIENIKDWSYNMYKIILSSLAFINNGTSFHRKPVFISPTFLLIHILKY